MLPNERRITAVPAGPPSTAAQGFECCDPRFLPQSAWQQVPSTAAQGFECCDSPKWLRSGLGHTAINHQQPRGAANTATGRWRKVTTAGQP